jgi:hypothetical protein
MVIIDKMSSPAESFRSAAKGYIEILPLLELKSRKRSFGGVNLSDEVRTNVPDERDNSKIAEEIIIANNFYTMFFRVSGLKYRISSF